MKKGILKKIYSYLQDNRYKAKLRSIRRHLRSCGEGLKIYGTPYIISPKNITIGEKVTLNDRCILNATGSSIVLGNNIVISTDAKIMAATLDTRRFVLEHRREHIYKDIYIGDNTWICTGVIICPGVHIKGDCIIAAGSVVTKDILDTMVIIAGNPARIVKKIQ